MSDSTLEPADQDRLSMVLFGHAAFQHLHAGCELGLFRLLHNRPGLSLEAVRDELGLQDRPISILLFGTTALRLIEREDDHYRNGPLISRLMQHGQWEAFEAAVEFEAHINYNGLRDFTASLRENSNVGLRRIPGEGPTLYHRLAQNDHLNDTFFRYMHAWSQMVNRHLIEMVDFGHVSRLLDVGGGDAVNAVALASAFPHLKVTVLELADVVPRALAGIREAGVEDRVSAIEGDMFVELPAGHDCMLFAHQVQIWPMERNLDLFRRANAALPPGGRVIITNSMADDSGDGPLYAALDSAYFAALPGGGGRVYTWGQLEECLLEAGFTKVERIRPRGAWTPLGIILGIK
ncbi:methyltransferase [Actinomadura nitritigenes]|uniref:methyltransferase n=1 Tax=Actinomadura nitritigenes TaxID=134602 RepID=UPI003D92F49C